MSTFEFANQALRSDLESYATALTTIVDALPRTLSLCDRIVKETRLAQALLAFASGAQAAEVGQIAYRLRNLWPYREQPYARTLGFSDEINEAVALRDEARRAIQILSRQGSDALISELVSCFANIGTYLEEQQRLLERCHAEVQPHAKNMDLTRKRLNLLIAAIDARLPSNEDQRETLSAYVAAAEILRDWETGVPIDGNGVQILQNCIECLNKADHLVLSLLNPAKPVRV